MPRTTLASSAKRLEITSNHPRTITAPERRQELASSGVTYIVRGEGTPLYKIGRTSGNPAARMQTMQTGSPVKLTLLVVLDHPRWEDVLHHHYRDKRRQGEWFELDARDLRQIKAWSISTTRTNG